MGYSVKVKIAQNTSIEVSGDDLELVVQLLNESTKKILSSIPCIKD